MGKEENSVQQSILDWAAAHGIPARRINNMPVPTGRTISYTTKKGLSRKRLEFRKNPNVKEGLPDIDMVIPPNHKVLTVIVGEKKYFLAGQAWGLPVKVEAKTKTGKQQDGQKEYEDEFSKAGALYILARNTQDVEKGIRNFVLDKMDLLTKGIV